MSKQNRVVLTQFREKRGYVINAGSGIIRLSYLERSTEKKAF